jgi:hypothetical protein
MPYGDRWRTRRRLFHEVLNATTVENFDIHQYKYAHRFLSRLLEAPERFMEEAELLAVSYPPQPNCLLMHPMTPEGCPVLSYCP